MNIDYKSPSELIPYINNAKVHTDEQVKKIAASITEFGFINPVIIDKNNSIIAGHGRLMAADKLKLKEVPTIKVDDLTDAQIKAYRLADNRLAEIDTDWDMELVNIELEELMELDFDVDLTGFDYEPAPTEEQEEIEDEVPELECEPIIQPGDLIELGNHRLLCGDSTKVDDVEKLMDGEKVKLFLTDPPYNVAYEGKTEEALTIQNDSMANDEFKKFLVDAFTCADTAMDKGACFYIWHADLEGYNFRGACFDTGWQIRQCLIWVKNCMVMGRQDYHWKHEPCLYGWKEGGAHYWGSDRTQTTCLEFNRPTSSRLHPTMKPINLLEYQVLNNTKQKQKVLDLFLGSGSTLIACEKTNRKCYGMELDQHYCDVIIERWCNYTGKDEIIINGVKHSWGQLKETNG